MHPLCDITRITYSIEGETLFRGMCIACTFIIEDTSARQSLARSPYLQTREIITNKQHRLDYFSINDDCIRELSKKIISIKSYDQNVCVGYVYHTDEEQTLT